MARPPDHRPRGAHSVSRENISEYTDTSLGTHLHFLYIGANHELNAARSRRSLNAAARRRSFARRFASADNER